MLFQTAKSRVYEGKITRDAANTSLDSLHSTLQPVLEEQPKWAVLAEVLEEIEQDAYLNPVSTDESNSSVLVMCTDQRTCRQIREYLGTMHARIGKDKPDEPEDLDEDLGSASGKRFSAEVILRRRLREYLDWKTSLANVNKNLSAKSSDDTQNAKGQESPRPTSQQGRAPPNKRRRVRGGGAVTSAAARVPNASVQTDTELPGQVSSLLEELKPTDIEEIQKEEIINDDFEDMEDFFELYDMDDLVIVHPYDGDMDEHILEEVRPRYIIMYEPDPAFIRRVEVYRSSHVARNIRVYFIYYGGSVEEQRYLSAVRREKDSFTKLIKEKGVSRFDCVSFVPCTKASRRAWQSPSPMIRAKKIPRNNFFAQ